MEPSDHSLVEAALQGDGEAFTDLVLRHYDRVLPAGLAGARLGSGCRGRGAGCLCGAAGQAGHVPARGAVHDLAAPHRAERRPRPAAPHGRREPAGPRAWGEVECFRRAEAAEAQAEQEWLMQAMAALPEALRENRGAGAGRGPDPCGSGRGAGRHRRNRKLAHVRGPKSLARHGGRGKGARHDRRPPRQAGTGDETPHARALGRCAGPGVARRPDEFFKSLPRIGGQPASHFQPCRWTARLLERSDDQ